MVSGVTVVLSVTMGVTKAEWPLLEVDAYHFHCEHAYLRSLKHAPNSTITAAAASIPCPTHELRVGSPTTIPEPLPERICHPATQTPLRLASVPTPLTAVPIPSSSPQKNPYVLHRSCRGTHV